jgi:hypothetical protein
MPPEVTWFTGRELIGSFLRSQVLTEPGRFQMIPVAANGQPALAAYMRGHDGGYRAHSICVLTIAASRVTRVISFNDPGLFATFGLPQTVPAAATAALEVAVHGWDMSPWRQRPAPATGSLPSSGASRAGGAYCRNEDWQGGEQGDAA